MEKLLHFDEVFEDRTKYGTKIKTEEYHPQGKNIIVDQGQALIAGYTDRQDGLFTDVPAIVFGDHTRVVKYIDKPFFLGADGVKVLKSKLPDASYKYLYYALLHARIPNTGYNRHFKWLKELSINYPDADARSNVVDVLDKTNAIISFRKQQLSKLDELVKARFVEMFGDPINNSLHLPTIPLGQICNLKAGITTSADSIHEQCPEYPIPCYGGNGIRGYVKDATQSGDYPLIGRQGALCGNVQLATGRFHATEHAVLVKPKIKTNIIWLFHLLRLMDLYRYHTGAAQPGLAVNTLKSVDVPIIPITFQNPFADFVTQVDKSKAAVQSALDKAQLLFDSLMQKYFG